MPPIVSWGTLLSGWTPVFEAIRSGTHPNCKFKGGVAGIKPSGHSGGHSLPGIHSFGPTSGGALDWPLSLLPMDHSTWICNSGVADKMFTSMITTRVIRNIFDILILK